MEGIPVPEAEWCAEQRQRIFTWRAHHEDICEGSGTAGNLSRGEGRLEGTPANFEFS